VGPGNRWRRMVGGMAEVGGWAAVISVLIHSSLSGVVDKTLLWSLLFDRAH